MARSPGDDESQIVEVYHGMEKFKMVDQSCCSDFFNCPIISATQLNRSGYDEENPGLDTISESIGMAATADCIFSIFQDEEDKELGIVKMGMMKNRFGANYGHLAMRINYDTLTISEDESLNVDDEDSEMSDLTNTLSVLSN